MSLSVYGMRMARVNITMPDDLHAEAKRAGLNISQMAQQAVAAELARLAKVAELDAYLAELDAELGPISEADRAEAKEWADKVLGADRRRRSA
jgi:post-segregation antitoxin (ccd killing protein)